MEREDIIRMAREAYGDWYPNAVPPALERFAALVATREREKCARIADTYGGAPKPMMVGTYEAGAYHTAEAIAAEIRARGEK